MVIGYDTEDEETSLLETDPEIAEISRDDRYLIMGFDQGQVVIMDIKNLNEGLISRHDVCRHKILMIREIASFDLHLIYDESHMLKLCSLTSTGTKYLHTFNLYRGLFDLLIKDNYVYLAF